MQRCITFLKHSHHKKRVVRKSSSPLAFYDVSILRKRACGSRNLSSSPLSAPPRAAQQQQCEQCGAWDNAADFDIFPRTVVKATHWS